MKILALDFDGVNDYVSTDFKPNLKLTDSFTISFWVKGGAYADDETLLGIAPSSGNQFFNIVGSTINPGQLRFYIRSSLGELNDLETSLVGSGTWKMITLVKNRTRDNYEVFENGISIMNYTDIHTTSMDFSSKGLSLGQVWNAGASSYVNPFSGSLDDVNFWKRALDINEIQNIYNSNLTYPFSVEGKIIIDLNSPTNNTELSDVGANFNVTIDSSSLVDTNITNLTYQLWKYNDTSLVWEKFNFTTLNFSGINQTTESEFIDSFSLGSYKWGVKACFANLSTTFCNSSEENYIFDVGSGITEEIYSNSTYESSSETFLANITTLSGSIIYSASLIYNGTEHIGIVTDLGNDTYHLSSTFYIPEVSSDVNITWYWRIYYDVNGNIISQDLDTKTQTILNLGGILVQTASCGTGYFKAINYTFQNSNNKSSLTIDTINYNFKYGIGNTSAKEIYGTFTNKGSFNICVNSSFNGYKFGYGEVEYEEDGFTQRKHYLYENQEISNGTTRSYILYSLPTADSTSFIFEVKDSGNTPYTNKLLALLRWYPETNGYLVVEMAKTDETGQTVMKVKTEDIDYRVGIYELDGSLIKLADPVRMACLIDPCTYTLSVRGEDTNYFSYEDVEGSLTFDEVNNRFLLVFNDVTQVTDSMRMEVYKVSGSQDVLICEDEVTGYTGVLSCSIGTYTGTFYAKVYRTASPERVFQKIFYTNRESVESSFGLVLSVVLALAGGLMGIFSPVIAVIMILVGLLLSLFLGSISMGIFMGIASMGGIVIHYILKLK